MLTAHEGSSDAAFQVEIVHASDPLSDRFHRSHCPHRQNYHYHHLQLQHNHHGETCAGAEQSAAETFPDEDMGAGGSDRIVK